MNDLEIIQWIMLSVLFLDSLLSWFVQQKFNKEVTSTIGEITEKLKIRMRGL